MERGKMEELDDLKQALMVAEQLQMDNVLGYSNDSNPFSDSKPMERFVWRGKFARDAIHGRPLEICSYRAEKKRARENMAEIEKVKKRREEIAIEKAQCDKEVVLLTQERPSAEYEDWEKKEEEFHFKQSKVRSEIRLREGRTRPIDVLSNMDEPYLVFKGLTVKELEEVRDDIKMQLDFDRSTPMHIEYWEALMVICDWELTEAQKKDALDRASVCGEEPPPEVLAEDTGLHSGVEADVKELLDGKKLSELESLGQKIESGMCSSLAKVVEFREAFVKQLHIYKTKACLREIHAPLLRKHQQRLNQPLETEQSPETYNNVKVEEEDEVHDEDVNQQSSVAVAEEPGSFSQYDMQEEPGSSPQLLHCADDDEGIDPDEDKAELVRKLQAVNVEQHIRMEEATLAVRTAPEDNFELKAMKAMGAFEEGDAVFGAGAEINLDLQVA